MTECEHDHRAGLNGQALAKAIADARGRSGVDVRWSEPRRRVLEQLLAAGTPVKAYDLIAGYRVGTAAKPPTVYRALEFLQEQGLVHKIASLGAYVACVGEGQHGSAFLVCTCCNRIEEFEPDDDKALATAARSSGFRVQMVLLEARGLCKQCQ